MKDLAVQSLSTLAEDGKEPSFTTEGRREHLPQMPASSIGVCDIF